MDEYLRNNPQFIIELKDIEEFKRLIWLELLRNNESDLNNLLSLYNAAGEIVKSIVDDRLV